MKQDLFSEFDAYVEGPLRVANLKGHEELEGFRVSIGSNASTPGESLAIFAGENARERAEAFASLTRSALKLLGLQRL